MSLVKLGLPTSHARAGAKVEDTHTISDAVEFLLYSLSFPGLLGFAALVNGKLKACFSWARGWIVVGWGKGGNRALGIFPDEPEVDKLGWVSYTRARLPTVKKKKM